jgi:hypothetical protein
MGDRHRLPQVKAAEGMRWFRAHMKVGSRLALVALAIQLVLTFGHVHGISAGAAESALSSVTHQAQNSADPCSNSGGSSDSNCPICALIQLAGTSAVSVPPTLSVPATFVVLKLQAPEQLEWAASQYVPFQARGPPSI